MPTSSASDAAASPSVTHKFGVLSDCGALATLVDSWTSAEEDAACCLVDGIATPHTGFESAVRPPAVSARARADDWGSVPGSEISA